MRCQDEHSTLTGAPLGFPVPTWEASKRCVLSLGVFEQPQDGPFVAATSVIYHQNRARSHGRLFRAAARETAVVVPRARLKLSVLRFAGKSSQWDLPIKHH